MFVKRGVLPGFGLSLGYTLLYLAFLVLLPLCTLVIKAGGLGPAEFLRVATEPRALAAYELSFGLSLLAAGANCVFGLLIAWVLVRYSFPGRDLADALVDLPFALPTAVAGIALTAIYAPTGWLGAPPVIDSARVGARGRSPPGCTAEYGGRHGRAGQGAAEDRASAGRRAGTRGGLPKYQR